MTFLLQIVSALIEPLAVIGYVLCGLFLPRLWLAFGGALGWAMLMNIWDSAQEKARFAVATSELVVPRLAAALLAAAVAYWAMDVWQRWRAPAPPQPYFPRSAAPMAMPEIAEEPEPIPVEPSLDQPGTASRV